MLSCSRRLLNDKNQKDAWLLADPDIRKLVESYADDRDLFYEVGRFSMKLPSSIPLSSQTGLQVIHCDERSPHI